mmetsp:Transcript_72954/g.146857  ORF Transcript_72954/g.146857 Transcript_72954/m.146857 type:complete len:560 (+) Transcript_72954:73-1752(+)
MSAEDSSKVGDPAESLRWMALAYRRVAAEELHVDETVEVKGSFTTKGYTTYSIKVVRPEGQGGTTTFAHRFSEFESLFAALKRRYGDSGMFVPPLPKSESSLTGKQDEAFKQRRMRALGVAMEMLHRNVFLRFDPLYLSFINPSTAKDASAEGSDQAFVGELGKSGDSAWDLCLSSGALPNDLNDTSEDDLEAKCTSLNEECSKAEKGNEGMLKAFTALQLSLVTQAKAYSDLETSTAAWASAESAENMPALNGNMGAVSVCVGSSMPAHQSVGALADCALPLAQALSNSEAQLKRTVKCLQAQPLEYLTEVYRELKAGLASGAELKKNAARLWATFYKVQAKKPTAAQAQAPEADGKSEVDLAKEAATKATADWAQFVKVLLLVSLPTVVLERSRLVREALGSYALCSHLQGTSIASNALHFFSSLNDQGAKVGAHSGGWSMATAVEAADASLKDALQCSPPLASFSPGAPPPSADDTGSAADEGAAADEGGGVPVVTTLVPAVTTIPTLPNALPAPPALPPVPAAAAFKPPPPPPVPAPPASVAAAATEASAAEGGV